MSVANGDLLQEALKGLNIKVEALTRLAGTTRLDESAPVRRVSGDPARGAKLSEGRDFLKRLQESREARRRGEGSAVRTASRNAGRSGRSSVLEELRGMSRALGITEDAFPAADTYHAGYRSSMRQDTIERVPAPYTAIPAGELSKTFQNVANVADVITARVTESIGKLRGKMLENAERVRRAMRDIANEAEDAVKDIEKEKELEKKPGEEEPVIQMTPKMAESLNDMMADIRDAGAFTETALREAGLSR
jgi:hypothetical protein